MKCFRPQSISSLPDCLVLWKSFIPLDLCACLCPPLLLYFPLSLLHFFFPQSSRLHIPRAPTGRAWKKSLGTFQVYLSLQICPGFKSPHVPHTLFGSVHILWVSKLPFTALSFFISFSIYDKYWSWPCCALSWFDTFRIAMGWLPVIKESGEEHVFLQNMLYLIVTPLELVDVYPGSVGPLWDDPPKSHFY